MEALPVLPLLAPQFRTSTLSYDNIPNFDFRLRMKEYILLTFNADPHDYDKAFEELAHMKFEANIPDPTPEQALKLKKYYSQLCMMQKRFPMAAGEAMETPFAWHDGLIDMRSAQSEVTICDIEFEKASVMFNIGACHAQCAAKEDRETQESIKSAFSHLQQATLAFEQLNTFRNSDFFYPSVDLDANVISFYYKVHLAQAQECLVQKSLLENRSPILIAKLCLWIQEAYESAVKIVDEWSINIPESVQRYYSKLCQMKSSIYGVIGYMSMGDHSEKEDKKMGWRLQYYNIANKYMEHLTQNSGKMRDRFPELFHTYSFLFDVISAKQKNAEKENDFIYHDRVPKAEDAVDTALKDGVRCIVDLKKVQLLDPQGYSPDLFGALLPGFVQEGVKKYDTLKEEILKEMRDIVKSYDDHLNYQLELSEFERLRFMLSNGRNREAWFEIPEDLMRRNADMTAYPDCVPNLIEKMRESSDTARVAEAKLNTLLSKLRAIDLPRLKADEGFNLIQKELERLAEHLEQAKTNNGSLNKAIAQHSANLQVLTLPCMEMWQKIVPVEEEGETKTSTAPSEQEKRMHEMVNKVLEMIEQRKTLISQLEAALKADDISSKMMGTNERGAEEIMYKELEKHSDAQKYIRLNATAQEAILRAFSDANADFFEERTEMAEKRKKYEQRVAELCASYEVYRDVQRKVEEGEQFYRQLMARCDQFAIPVHAMEEQYREELEKKERAKQEAEHHMNQLRMSREAQNALMDFGGGAPSPRGPPGSMGPMGAPGAGYPRSQGPPGPHSQFPAPRGGSGPRLGDFMDSYRARKQIHPPQAPPTSSIHPDEHGGPPSPTPSSICDFPVSNRSQRFGPVSPNPSVQNYGAPAGPQYQPTPYQAPPPIHPGTPAYQQASSPYPLAPGAAPSSYQVPRIPPGYVPQGPAQAPPTSTYPGYTPSPVQGGPPAAQYQASGYAPSGAAGQEYPPQAAPPPQQAPQYPPQAPPTQQAPQLAPQGYSGYAPSPVQGGPGPQQHYQAPPTSQQAPPPAHGYAPSPVQGAPQQQYQGPTPSHGYTPSPVQGGPTPGAQHQAPPTQHQGYPGGYQAPPPTSTGYAPSPIPAGPAPGAPQYQAPPPTSTGYAASPVLGAPGAPQHQAPPTSGYQGYQAPLPVQYQAPPTSQGYPGSYQAQAPPPMTPNYVPSHAPPTPQTQAPPPPPPPQYPSYQQAPPPAQPTFQHPPQGPPISAPPPSSQQQVHQHVSTPGAPGAPQQQQQPQGARFTPTPGAPSPWHATPAELKTPWNTTPQYHAQPTSNSGAAGASGAPQASGAPAPAKSNVDLLSDLLGDFNMAPTMQPIVQNQQQLQQRYQQQAPPPQQHQAPPPSQQSDFRQAHLPPEPPSKPFVRPAAAVQPMPQQPQNHNVAAPAAPELSQIAQQHANNALETPILIKGSPSITELADPSKFEMGQGNVQKLEKRMLHQSFRTNGPPPPLNQSDPLNQIDAFSSFTARK